jgi:hypothetical protein
LSHKVGAAPARRSVGEPLVVTERVPGVAATA